MLEIARKAVNISIHALHEESDSLSDLLQPCLKHFNPRSP